MAATQDLTLLLDRRVAALKKAQPESSEALDVQAALIRASLSSARPPEAQSFVLPREHVAARVRRGVPLLHEQPVRVDVNFAAYLVGRVLNVLEERDDPELRSRLDDLIAAATGGSLEPERLFGEAFVQHQQHLAEVAFQAGGVDPELLATLASQAVAPLLRAYAQRLMPLLERLDDGSVEGVAWSRGYCPVCGAWPLLAELRGVELAQFLRCGACGSAWRSQRLFCPYCANEDYRSLGTLTVEGEQRFRVAVCERCNGYLKVVNAFDPAPAELLGLQDAASVHLDLAAIERGYRRPSGTGYAIELAVAEEAWLEELG